MRRDALVVPLLLLASVASVASAQSEDAPRRHVQARQARKPLTSGEFYDARTGANTAHTLEKGEVAYHPLGKNTAVGITDDLDVKFPTLGLIAGPRLILEYAPVQDEDLAISIGPDGFTSFDLRTYDGGATVRLTKGMGLNRLNLGLGGRYAKVTTRVRNQDGEVTKTWVDKGGEIPIDLGFDLVVSENTTFTWSAHIEPLAMVDGSGLYAVPHFGWTHATGGRFRIALGLNVIIGGLPMPGVSGLGSKDRSEQGTFVVPLPHFQMWWKF